MVKSNSGRTAQVIYLQSERDARRDAAMYECLTKLQNIRFLGRMAMECVTQLQEFTGDSNAAIREDAAEWLERLTKSQDERPLDTDECEPR
jgi:hypothetical protein